MAGEDWSKKEVELAIKDYFDMLHAEMNLQSYNKSQHRNELKALLNDRSERSVDAKHQNISAVLIKLEQPYIKGYKPYSHYQKILEIEVIKYLENHSKFLERDFEKFTEIVPEVLLQNLDFTKIIDDEPVISKASEEEISYRPIKTNFLQKEQNNRQLGEKGEDLVVEYEKWRLINSGKESLAEKIEWISKEKGDGAGFDILSRNENGTDRYIEVKTTKLSKETPIYLTKTELNFANDFTKNFYLYRVFKWGVNPQLFIKHGRYENFCELKALSYKGYFL